MYFEKYGCIACRRKNASYASHGLCRACSGLIGDRLRRTDAKMQKRLAKNDDGAARIFLRRLESAKRLLGDLRAILD
jgi:hypothetical protein